MRGDPWSSINTVPGAGCLAFDMTLSWGDGIQDLDALVITSFGLASFTKCKKCWNVYYESATQDKLGLSSISFRTCSFCFLLKGVHKKVRSTKKEYTNMNIISLPVIRLIIHHDSNSCRQCILKSLVGIFSDNVQLFQANEKSLR